MSTHALTGLAVNLPIPGRRCPVLAALVVLALAVPLAGCGGSSGAPEEAAAPPTMATTDPSGSEGAGQEEGPSPGSAPPEVSPAGYLEATTGDLDPAVRDVPHRVYVPNSEAGTVSVIDPDTYQVIATHEVGVKPHHVTPSWDMQTLYALDTAGNQLIPFDPGTAAPGEPIPVEDPYNLYFTPDGETAVVVAERYSRIDLRDPETWELEGSVPVEPAGVNHGDFSVDGSQLFLSTEWSGYVVRIDLERKQVVAQARVGEEPIDMKLSPDGEVLFVVDQSRHGVIVLNPDDLQEIDFIPTGEGAHGVYYNRDATRLYVSNRLAGTVSVVDVASRTVEDTWTIPGGGSPDMGGVSVDGSELWLTGRYHGEVYVFDTGTGEVLHRIPTGEGAHGAAVWPQPGRYSTGHTGVMR